MAINTAIIWSYMGVTPILTPFCDRFLLALLLELKNAFFHIIILLDSQSLYAFEWQIILYQNFWNSPQLYEGIPAKDFFSLQFPLEIASCSMDIIY